MCRVRAHSNIRGASNALEVFPYAIVLVPRYVVNSDDVSMRCPVFDFQVSVVGVELMGTVIPIHCSISLSVVPDEGTKSFQSFNRENCPSLPLNHPAEQVAGWFSFFLSALPIPRPWLRIRATLSPSLYLLNYCPCPSRNPYPLDEFRTASTAPISTCRCWGLYSMGQVRVLIG